MGCFSSRVDAPTEELPSTPADTAAPTQPAAALPSVTDLGVDEEKLAGWRRYEEELRTSLELEQPILTLLLFALQQTRRARNERRRSAGTLKMWRERGGGDLEPVLASGAVALLDAQWIISHAEAGGVLSHRQALPKEAFLSLANLVEVMWEQRGPFLPVAALSYPWLTKDHPDPCGANLSRVARALKAMLSDPDNIPRLGVFWDFGSLHQHPDPTNGVLRTEEQNALFKQGLGCLGTLYSHPSTYVLRLTSFPDGHTAEDQAEGTNVAKYFDRGWCFTEACLASLTKSSSLSLDLGKMRDGEEKDYGEECGCEECGYWDLVRECTQDGGRRPPLVPSAFAAELETKSFTNGKDDKPLVKRLYEAAFKEQFGKAIGVNYCMLGWGDAEAAQLAEVLASGAAPRLEDLWLDGNETIRDEGCKALAAALKEGAAPSLKARDEYGLPHAPSPAQCSSHLPSRAEPHHGQQAA